jgi:type II secretory pathway pseudopilin PulG
MIELNFISISEPIKSYANIIGPLLGGIIAASAGIYLSNYKEKRAAKDRQKVVAMALYEQMSSYFDLFGFLFENYNTTKFDQAYEKTKTQKEKFYSHPDDMSFEGPYAIKEFETLTMEQIYNLNLATKGKHATFIPEINPFSKFYEDIFKFDNIDQIRNIVEYYQYLIRADKYFKNFCNEDMEYPNDLDFRKFLDSIEIAHNIVRDEKILEYLDDVQSDKNNPILKMVHYYNFKDKYLKKITAK